MNYMTLHADPAQPDPTGVVDTTGKYVLVPNTEVMPADWPEKVDSPTYYASVDAALSAGETLFAVGTNFMGQNVRAITRVGDERLEITLAE